MRAMMGAQGESNGAKYWMNIGGVPVGDARLPSLPVTSDVAAQLSSTLAAHCDKMPLLADGKAIRLCRMATSAALR